MGRKLLYDEDNINNAALAIQEKLGSTEQFTTADFADMIARCGAALTQFDSLQFDGKSYINLPIGVNANYSYYIDFTVDTFAGGQDMTLFAVSSGVAPQNLVSVSMWNLRYQVGQNGGCTNVVNSWDDLLGRHEFLFDGNGSVSFDNGSKSYTYTPNTYSDYTLQLGARANGCPFTGKIHRFTVKDETQDELVMDLVPAGYTSENSVLVSGMLDLVSDNFLTQSLLIANNTLT
jgi:hypothetical protein